VQTLNADSYFKKTKYRKSKARSDSRGSGKFGSLETKAGIFAKIVENRIKLCNQT